MNLSLNEQIIKQLRENGLEVQDIFLLICLYKQENELLLVWNENLSNNQIFFTVYQKLIRLNFIQEDYNGDSENTYKLSPSGELLIKEIIENQ